MRRYAKNTVVAEERSRTEIERSLRRFGADQFAYATDEQKRAAAIQFRYRGMMIRMVLGLPDQADFQQTPQGRPRAPSIAQKEYERERKRVWRALALAIKAKLVAVEEKITTFETEWLAYVVWGDGRTTAEHLVPAMAAGAVLPPTPQALLPGPVPRTDPAVIDAEYEEGETATGEQA